MEYHAAPGEDRVSLPNVKHLPTVSTTELESPSSPHTTNSIPALTYVYDPLPEQGWIRLLVLHPGTGPLSCRLEKCKLEQVASTFEALSYVWGLQHDGINIECEGRQLSIGPNLAAALHRLRDSTEPRLLWVDAACINQRDKDEKSHQVRQMGNLYESAKRVLIWVGEDTRNEAGECFAVVQDTVKILADIASKHGGIEKIPTVTQNSGIIDPRPEIWAAVHRLVYLEWFERVWVLQEVGLAGSALLIYGEASMNWSYLVELMLMMALRADIGRLVGNVRHGLFWDVFDDIWRTYENPVSWRNELPLTRSMNQSATLRRFIDILNDGRQYKATNPRDRVYAFLAHPSVSGHDQKGALSADYNKSVDEVYHDAARHILLNDPCPWTLLSCVDHIIDSPSLKGERPSWIPRWDENWRVYWFGYPTMYYRAGGDSSKEFKATASPSLGILELSGLLLDDIVWCSDILQSEDLLPPGQIKNRPFQLIWGELEKLRHEDRTSPYGKTSEERELAYSLTVVAGRNTDDDDAELDLALHQSIYQRYKEAILSGDAQDTVDSETSNEMNRDVVTYITNQRRALHNRRFYLTSKGYYGICHMAVEAGDVCCVFEGANVPFVLRRVVHVDSNEVKTEGQSSSVSNRYMLIGESYIHGIMHGEASGMAENGDLYFQEVVLV
ncbi:hypothetical protein PV08_04872 [Exophiala spinifera]|uniref:Heterokaryon incompatibility domain-containing protein n=1 Tax=Exophiala spinifera TaxID=91928 RepID=A0A0D1ZYE9_9EURO|nr:uncharacterized protein PV08_04872 [Exophiala spinifera]KIW17677.1 hypothetical protein PV08_04872 [Exophiala spinifera]